MVGPRSAPQAHALTDAVASATAAAGWQQPMPSGQAVAHTSVDSRAHDLGRVQHGLATQAQLLSVGISKSSIRRRFVRGVWTQVAPGVIDLGTHGPSWERSVMRGLLRVHPREAWASHQTAAVLHALLDVARPAVCDIAIKDGYRPKLDHVAYRRLRTLSADDTTVVDGLPVTTLARTIVDIAPLLKRRRLEAIVWDAARRRPQLPSQVAAVLARDWRFPGSVVLREILQGIHPEIVRAESPLEVAGLLFVREAGLPAPRLQWVVRDSAGRFVARVDAAWIDARIALEFNGRAYHQTPSQRDDDRERRARLRRLGWEVVEITAAHLREPRRQDLARQLHELFAARSGRRALA